MGGGTGCMKCCLIFVNTLLLLLSIAFITAGFLLKFWVAQNAETFIQPYLDKLKDLANDPNAEVNIDLSEIIDPAFIALLVIGGFFFILAIISFIGTCCNVRCMLLFYFLILVCMLVVEIVLISLLFTGGLDETLQGQLVSGIKDNYVDVDDYGIYSLAWNYVMMKFQCCGVNDYEDFKNATKWNPHRKFSYGGFTFDTTLVTPIACCVFVGDFPELDIKDELCASQPNDLISNWKLSCWTEVVEYLSEYKLYVFLTISLLLVFQAILAAFSLALFCVLQDSKVHPDG